MARATTATVTLAMSALVIMETVALAQSPRLPSAAGQIDTVQIEAAGIYASKLLSKSKSDTTATGDVNHVDDPKLIEETDVVCARLGTSFGFYYTPQGRGIGPLQLEWVTRFPEPVTRPDGKRLQESRLTSQAIIGARTYRSYAFDHAWEVVPGIWSLDFYFEGRKVGGKTFTVLATCPIS
jgi:hypothetical protein